MLRYANVDDFMASMDAFRDLATTSFSIAESQIVQHAIAGYKPIRFERATPDLNSMLADVGRPFEIGNIGPYKVIIDSHAKISRFRISDEFRRLQDLWTVIDTQQWADEFFGVDYPVYATTDKVVMHPKAFDELLNKYVYVWG